MAAKHLELLVEELSMEAFLRALLPRLLPQDRTFAVHAFHGKSDLLGKLEARLRGYAQWLPEDWRIVVLVDRDNDDCRELKRRLEAVAQQTGLRTKSGAGGLPWQLVNRLVIEELEAWYFGDWEAACAAYPRLSPTIANQPRFRDPDNIAGGTWEMFERVMRQHGYFKGGLPKIKAARTLGSRIDAQRSRSTSFRHFRDAVLEAVT